MKTTIDYLNDAKSALGAVSDYELANKLEVERASISQWRAKSRIMDNYAASKIADALGIEAIEVIAAANVEKEKDESRRDYWRSVQARTKRAVAGMLAALVILTGGDGKPRTVATAHNA
jgi:transcriptional regulator with XRE-family HTH domain